MQDESSSRLVVLYASQTGTAQDVAERIGRQARRRHLKAIVASVDDYPLEQLLEEELVIFVLATTGQGDEPANMKSFWRFLLRADLPSDLFEHLQFTVFGLGDSSYPKFNWPAKKLYKRLKDLGAETFYEKGEGDDQDYLGIDTTLNTWLEGLWGNLLEAFPVAEGLSVIPDDVLPPPWLKITPIHTNGVTPGKGKEREKPEGTLWTTLSKNERATASDHFQDVRYLEFSFEHDLDFQPGDVAELRPENPPELISTFIDLMQWSDSDMPLQVQTADQDRPLPPHWPRITTLRQLLTSYLDIFSVPRKSFFEFLSYFTTDPTETEKLREFISPEGQEDLWDYANRPRRTIYEVLTEFKSARRIPLDYLADIFPEMKPRQFSIASSSKVYPRQVHLLVAIVKYKTKLSISRRGVCTTWLANLPTGTRLPIAIRSGSLLVAPSSTPIICIGPGTGIAPFRSFIQERRALQSPSRDLVFVGCRNVAKDYFYRDEWEKEEMEGGVKVVVAASRDQDEKVYVQDKIKEQAELVWEMLDRGAWIYISGAADKMPTAVREALVWVCDKKGKISTKEAKLFVERLSLQGRLQEETWS